MLRIDSITWMSQDEVEGKAGHFYNPRNGVGDRGGGVVVEHKE